MMPEMDPEDACRAFFESYGHRLGHQRHDFITASRRGIHEDTVPGPERSQPCLNVGVCPGRRKGTLPRAFAGLRVFYWSVRFSCS